MLQQLKDTQNYTFTENGAITHRSTLSDCLDLFATIGALRASTNKEIITRFMLAWAEDATLALKILFFARDVRGGLGERRVFRVILRWLARQAPATVRKNLAYIAEFGRHDDVLPLLGTPCEKAMLEGIRQQLDRDKQALAQGKPISLLAKWLPSVNASNRGTVLRAKRIARGLGMNDAAYRKMFVPLREHLHLVENHLRLREYTFSYEAVPSQAMLRYRRAFRRNDGERYNDYMGRVATGEAKLNTATLTPYDIVRGIVNTRNALNEAERMTLDVSWNALENFGGKENALVVVDGSGSMYFTALTKAPVPAAVAQSLGVYFAERNTGVFRNHFITFSRTPQLVEIKGRDIWEKVRYCMSFSEVANTDVQAVFELVLKAAVEKGAPQGDLPTTLYFISDMEFDRCAENTDVTNFQWAKAQFEAHGYSLPRVVFWNVASRNRQQPVTYNEQGVALVSGFTPRLFSLLASGKIASPHDYMMDILGAPRYADIEA